MSDPDGLLQILEAAILRALKKLRAEKRLHTELPEELKGLGPDPKGKKLSPVARQIARDLIVEALSNGLLGEPTIEQIEHSFPTAGSTAEVVSFPNASLTFAYKMSAAPKLADEAKALRSIRQREKLPLAFRESFPRVYASRTTQPPYAYLMQHFPFPSFEKLLFRSKTSLEDLQIILAAILDALISAYVATKDTIVTPNLKDIYLQRIVDRLDDAAEMEPLFKRLQSSNLTINGRSYRPLLEYLVEAQASLPQIACGFSTFAHGDPHPENILVDLQQAGPPPAIKFIDVKAWWKADYLFDIGKLCHYMLVTGPVEKTKPPTSVTVEETTEGFSISYELQVTNEIRLLHDQVIKRIETFAKAQKDLNWFKRYNLSMAANLLGLPPGRLGKEMRQAALIYYSEGLTFLERAVAVPPTGEV